jgi:hypothetical protein
MTSLAAIDWSGRKDDRGRTIWLAVVEAGKMVRLENGWSREGLVDALRGMRERADRLIVGIDFAFSFPADYCRQQGWASGRDVWQAARDHGEEWLRGEPGQHPVFWGRVPKTAIEGHQEYRRTELWLREHGFRPKSVFQTGGAGQVGTGAIRGMPMLASLADSDFAIWPFDDPAGRSAVIEIYPRLLTGPVIKTSVRACLQHLDRYQVEIPDLFRGMAATTEDSFDAAVSAIEMWRHRDSLAALSGATDTGELLEGAIWVPTSEPPANLS